jgi:hypothetical protein
VLADEVSAGSLEELAACVTLDPVAIADQDTKSAVQRSVPRAARGVRRSLRRGASDDRCAGISYALGEA